MPASLITSWAQVPSFRRAVCAVLVSLLLLSGMSFDVCITHAQGTEAEHSHVSRVFGVKDSQDHHHDHHHHPSVPVPPVPPDSPVPGGQPNEPSCCCVDTGSTVIVRSVGQTNRQSRDAAKHLLDHLNVAACIGGVPIILPDGAAGHRGWSFMAAPASAHVLRSSVLLI